MESKIAKRCISQKHIGYTTNMETVIESEVEYMDGTVGVLYETWKRNENGFFFHTGNHEFCPLFNALPNTPSAGHIQTKEKSTPVHYMQTKEDVVDHWKRSVQAYNAIKAESDRSFWHDFSGTLTPIYSMIGMRQKLDQAVAQHGSDVQDRFAPLNCCILDYANQRLYSVDRLAYFQLDGDQVVLIEEEAQAQHG